MEKRRMRLVQFERANGNGLISINSDYVTTIVPGQNEGETVIYLGAGNIAAVSVVGGYEQVRAKIAD
jgi:hypothetical protein